MKVTWIIPVRNGMPYLPEALESISSQTFRDFEVLAWDNGSTDGSVEELQRWIPERIPGRVITGEPLPLGQCLAALVEKSTTDYLARMDCDDISMPERLAKQVAFLDAHPEVGVVSSQYEQINADGSLRGVITDFPADHEGILHRMPWQNAICHPASMLRRETVLSAGNYHDLKPVEDLDLWLRIAQIAKLANIDEVLLRYRMHPDSVTQLEYGLTLEKHVEDCLAKHMPGLYGISEDEARALYRRDHPRVIDVFKKMADHFQQEYGGGSRWKVKSFVDTAEAMIPPSDNASRAQLMMLTGRTGRLMAGVARRVARKIVRPLRRHSG